MTSHARLFSMKIPQQAKRVFQGIIFDVYQWQQKMFDGSEATFEMLKRPNTVQVIAARGESILIGEEEQPNYAKCLTLFGGRVEAGETELNAAKRELLEEAGLASEDWMLYRMDEPVLKLDWQIHTFIARDCRTVADQQLDSGERISIKEVSFDAFIDIVCSERFFGDELAKAIMRMRLSPDAHNQFEEFRKLLFK